MVKWNRENNMQMIYSQQPGKLKKIIYCILYQE